ncbi:EscU/YscU/HrcU family type III secretion system export apparatus switch protein [Undibacterium oligocarboniphilum]|uniref:EscU/YscU/HrcU family type III secretion system export apparatus switch protein n=1 Tax=Undibacterium oligocarboniphilum TaxID=666702 RepID=A0A850QGY2_9BURK|nr:EscU/YscU/HrcU family type III secretion system export apparatus switch protein [Undibacterium oligocarboniphilum]MBC3870266.1 EscU/YscU/HrcU family type III secretion system export apparatus switch protein [Undibacterium oligocarboniphilum]NVO78257.1 EscU/YscU/HrcU family type III secretion system export apparatus switch protein [Undibacterium oligocarboniphilum]
MNTQPDKNAVAIAYQSGDNAPRVIAKGKGLIADEIITRAKEHGIHVHESRELVSLLMKVDLDTHIPPALYLAVAELLAWLYHIENEKSATDRNHYPARQTSSMGYTGK